MNREYIINLIDEINKIKLGSIVEITRDNEKHKYKVQYETDYDDIELVSIDEKNTIWGSCGETIKGLKEDILCGGIYNRYQKITVL